MTRILSIAIVCGLGTWACSTPDNTTAAATPPTPPQKEVAPETAEKAAPAAAPAGDIFSLSVNTLEGEAKSLADYKGKAVLFVNTASQCGYTPQYEGLQNLYGKYKDRGLVVAGFPCNQFGGQEPGGSSEIRSFCTTKYGVKFPMFEKVEVNGSGRHPLYAALTPTADSSGEAGDVKWNFEKFLLHADGTTIERFRSSVEPESETLVAAIEKALPQG